jgi:hypothetical protein
VIVQADKNRYIAHSPLLLTRCSSVKLGLLSQQRAFIFIPISRITGRAGKRIPLFLLLLAICVPLRAAAPSDVDNRIWRPRLPTPALTALDTVANRQFTAEVRGSASAHDWHVNLANDLRSWPCELVSATFSTIKLDAEPGWQIKARVPADISPELFSVTVSSDECTSVQPQAVAVSPTFATDFYVLHLSDEQIVNDKHTDPAGTYLRMVGSNEEMHWMQEPINLIHPRFAIVTGDQIDFNGALDGWNNWANWGYRPTPHKHFTSEETTELETRLSEMYLECHRGYRVPYCEAPGNHDVTPAEKKLTDTDILWHPQSVAAYEKYFGQRTWSFRMDDFYVLLHDWTEHNLKEWATADYDASLADPTIKFRLIGQHFKTDQGFVPKTCDLMVIGHGHKVLTIQSAPYFIYEDGPTFRYGTAGFFNFRKTPGGWTCDQTGKERDVSRDVLTMFTDNGVTKKVRSDQPDAMNVTANSVTVTNDLPQEFYDGRVRFTLDRGHYASIHGGTILAQYDYQNDTKTAVLVKVDIPAKGSITVTIDPPK